MKSWLIIISLLLSSFMIHETRGMSLRRGSLPHHYESDIHQKIVPLDEGLTNIVDQVREKFSGRSRKLIVSPTSSTTQTAKNVKNHEEDKALSNTQSSSNKGQNIGKKEEKISVNSSSHNQEVYPDVMDIAGMDYSQARRRPPIHN